MLENVAAVMARIEEIKSHFQSAQAGGEVTVAPHTTASMPSQVQSASVQPYFPSYLAAQLQKIGKNSICDISSYQDMIDSAASKYGVDPALIKGVIRAESGFKSNAVSSSGAQGLMQLMPSTADALGCSDPFDPEQNIDAGAKYLKEQMNRFGSVELALAAYNAGTNAVAKYRGVPPYRETQNYVRKVLSYRDDYLSR
ncbi:MAG: lytic transglycosylase domain-containing protein [Armatimonadota bacterium]